MSSHEVWPQAISNLVLDFLPPAEAERVFPRLRDLGGVWPSRDLYLHQIQYHASRGHMEELKTNLQTSNDYVCVFMLTAAAGGGQAAVMKMALDRLGDSGPHRKVGLCPTLQADAALDRELLIVGPPPLGCRTLRTALDNALAAAALSGQDDCMRLAINAGAKNADTALRAAAEGGHPDCMRVLKDMGAANFVEALEAAASGGNLPCMELARQWALDSIQKKRKGAVTQESLKAVCDEERRCRENPLREAALSGHIRAMKQARAWGAEELDEPLDFAADGGHVYAIDLLVQWGATDFGRALETAACMGHPAAMQRLKEAAEKKGVKVDHERALVDAACGGRTECMEMARSWGAPLKTTINAALVEAAGCGEIGAMRLARRWGATSNYDAFMEAAKGGVLHSMWLAREWMLWDGTTPSSAANRRLVARAEKEVVSRMAGRFGLKKEVAVMIRTWRESSLLDSCDVSNARDTSARDESAPPRGAVSPDGAGGGEA